MANETAPARERDVLQGTLDLMVLQALETMGPQHGYGIARRIEQISEDALKLNEGTVARPSSTRSRDLAGGS